MSIYGLYLLFSMLTLYFLYYFSRKNIGKIGLLSYCLLFCAMIFIGLFHYYIMSDRQFLFFPEYDIRKNKAIIYTAILFFFVDVYLMGKITIKRNHRE